MTFPDLLKLIRHYKKIVISVLLCFLLAAAIAVILIPPAFQAKATLLTNGDIALACGYAQNEAKIYSQNGIVVSASADAASRTITIEAEGSDYGGCIAAANATVLTAASEFQRANSEASVTTNEADSAEMVSQSAFNVIVIALLAGVFVSICVLVLLDLIRTPIKSRRDIEIASGLPILGVIPNRDRGERLVANIRFLSEDFPSIVSVVPTGHSGGALASAELASAFEQSKISATRIKGSSHAQGLNTIALPDIITIVECSPLSEGVGAVYIAKESNITIICVCEWRDTRKSLSSVVEELKFAKVNIGGVIFLTTGYAD